MSEETSFGLGDMDSMKLATNQRVMAAISGMNDAEVSETASCIKAAIATGKYGPRWASERIRDLEAHETRLTFLKLMAADPDAFYKCLLLGGVGLAFMGGVLASTDIGGGGKKDAIGEIKVMEFLMIPAGVSLATFAAIMLAFPRVFGPDGIKFEGSANFMGVASGEVKIG